MSGSGGVMLTERGVELIWLQTSGVNGVIWQGTGVVSNSWVLSWLGAGCGEVLTDGGNSIAYKIRKVSYRTKH